MIESGGNALLVGALCDPQSLKHHDARQWDSMLRSAAATGLTARLCAAVDRFGLSGAVPPRALARLDHARRAAESEAAALRHALVCAETALAGVEAPILHLHGPAGFASFGETPPPLHLLTVPAAADEIRTALRAAGWTAETNRRWRHELRGAALELRDSVCAETAYDDVTSRIVAQAVPSALSRFAVPSPQDRVLLAALALFRAEGSEYDLARLLAVVDALETARDLPGLWETLVPRAQQLRMTGALYHALRYAQAMFRIDIPAHVKADSARVAEFTLFCWLMDWAAPRALLPADALRPGFDVRLARRFLSLRMRWQTLPRAEFLRSLWRETRGRAATPPPPSPA